MISYPVEFEASSESEFGIKSKWKVTASGIDIQCSIPKEFEGDGDALSPEDFFMMSLQNCFVATFKVFAEYSKLKFHRLLVDAKLKVDKDSENKPWMEEVKLKIQLLGVKQEDYKKAQLLIQKTLDNGFILRSVKSKIQSEIMIKNENT